MRLLLAEDELDLAKGSSGYSQASSYDVDHVTQMEKSPHARSIGMMA